MPDNDDAILDLDRSRFEKSLPRESLEEKSLCIVGCGNIGSHTALALVQMGFQEILLFDPDVVEVPNITVQHYDNTHLGWPKVEALKSQIMRINPLALVNARARRWNGMGHQNVVVLATDNIKSRRQFVDTFRPASGAMHLLVDARMFFDHLEVNLWEGAEAYTGAGERAVAYRISLTETDYVKGPCGEASTNYTGRAAAAIIAAQVRRFLMEEEIFRTVLFDLDMLELETFR